MAGIPENSFRPLNLNEWLDFTVDHPGLKHYVSVVERPGNLALMATAEYQLFPPETAANEKFHVNLIEWNRSIWNVFSAPQERHGDIVRTARTLAMRICNNPPAMLFLSNSAMVLTVPPTAKEEEVKSTLRRAGMPAAFVNTFRGLETFPGIVKTIHAVENDPLMLAAPLTPEEYLGIIRREMQMAKKMSLGLQISPEDVAAYVYGSSRILSTPRQG